MQELFVYDPQTAGTKGLVFIGDKVLVYRRDDKTDLFPLKIDVPGGGFEGKETPYETFKREVYEEFGLEINKSDITYLRTYPSSTSPGKTAYFVVAKLPTEMESKIKFGNEGTEYMLMTLGQYISLNDAWPVFQERASDYHKSLL